MFSSFFLDVVRDVVFTTNESPPSEPIPFHHEIAQVPDPPSYIMFYCDVEPAKGGETPIIRSDQVCDYFFQEFPEFAAEVESKGVKYIRVMPLEDDNTSAIGRSWKSTFQCTTKKEAEDAMTKIGTTWEWLKNGDVRTTSAAVPAIRTDQRSGRKMFFNSMVAAYTGWIDSRNDPTKAIILGDDSAINGAALLKVAEFQRDHRVCFQWKKGDIILIDNFVTMHSRNTFERPRRILAAIGGPSQDGYGKRTFFFFRLISFICQRNNAKMYLRYFFSSPCCVTNLFFFPPIFLFHLFHPFSSYWEWYQKQRITNRRHSSTIRHV